MNAVQQVSRGIYDSFRFDVVFRLHRYDRVYRGLVWDTQRIQCIIFACQILFSYIIQPILDWCWMPIAVYGWFLRTYIMIVFELIVFAFVGWKTIDLNYKFARITSPSTSTSTTTSTTTATKPRFAIDQAGILWNKMIAQVYLVVMEFVKLIVYSIISRILHNFVVASSSSGLSVCFCFAGLSLVQSIQIFDQTFVNIPARILSRMYDHYLWYFIGFGSWISIVLLMLPLAFHLKLIVIAWLYPWLLPLSMNASIQPNIQAPKKAYGIEWFLGVSTAIFLYLLSLAKRLHLDVMVTTLLSFNLYHWKPVLYSCAILTMAMGCVRLLMCLVNFLFKFS